MNPGVMIITGTARGIGYYLAQYYLEQGWMVEGCSRGAGTIESDGYHHTSLDVADEAAVVGMVRSVLTRHGKIDALINNAGIASMNAALLTPAASFTKVWQTNCLGSFLFAREVGKSMLRQKRGRLIFFSTVARPLQLEGESAYAASKAAVESLVGILSRELGTNGITVNAVGPTPVETDLIKGVPGEAMERLIARQAIPRMGELQDVSNVTDFFLQESSDFITGQVIYLGGVGN
jgi:3-oxoacyl-[acyl-carrier protein] reductase